MSILRLTITVSICAILLIGCAVPGPSPEGTAPASPQEEPGIVMDRVDRLVAGELGRFLPPVDRWAPRENVSPAPAGKEITCRRVPLSSLAYYPRFRHRLQNILDEAELTGGTIERYPDDGGDTWEISIPFDGNCTYRLVLTQKITGRAALIIDDCGNSLRNKAELFSFDVPLTLAVLPGLAYTARVDKLAAENGYEVILHFPLEASNPDLVLGPGGLYRGASREGIAEAVKDNLADLPHAVGVNNHMGSAFTSDTDSMRLFLEELNKRDLFFIDSLTVSGTVTGPVAETIGIAFDRRDVFLDHSMKEEEIVRQFDRMKAFARKHGETIAIAHDRPLTVTLLTRLLPTLGESGIQIVPVSALLKH